MEKEFDFVAIGDIVTDAFIRLDDAEIGMSPNTNQEELCLRFGDKVPYEFMEVVRAVGNSPNAAVAAARLGLKTALVSNMGKDIIATESIDYLKKENVDTNFLNQHDGVVSNYHYVLWYKEDRTILVKHEKYPRAFPNIGKPKWIYLSSLGEDSLTYHDEIAKYLKENTEIKLAFQPGTFQMKMGTEKLKEIYARTDIFFCNLQEAKRILKMDGKNDSNDVMPLIKGLRELGPKNVVITDGLNGAYSYDGQEILAMPIYPDKRPPYERTGAGDAFSSTVTVALALGRSLKEALMWGPINSMEVVQAIGAQKGLLHRDKLEEYLRAAQEDYKAKKME